MTDRSEPQLSRTFAQIAVFAMIGAVAGLVVGLILTALFDGRWVDNPFWAMAAGIMVGAIATGTPRPG